MSLELSTAHTFAYRWVIPGLLSVLALAVIWWLAVPARGERPDLVMAAVALLLAVAMMVIARFFDRAKRVWCEADGVRVSDYRRETRVAWRDIAGVEVTRLGTPRRVRLLFRRPTVFGESVVFFPPAIWFGHDAEPPCVALLARHIRLHCDADENAMSA